MVYELASDVTPPAVASTSPAPGASNVRTDTLPTATFSERLQPGATATLSAGGAAVAASAALDSSGLRLVLTPAVPLAAGTTYTAAVTGARDVAGNVMASAYTWTFTTAGVAACPCTLYPSDRVPAVVGAADTSALELGVRFTPSVNGFVTGVRFYKGAGNTGTHRGSLWTAAGSLLTTATFTAETATGWQEVAFGSPVAVTAGATYVASYTAPVGRYAADSGQFATDAWQNGPLTAPASTAAAPNGVYGAVGRFPTQSFGATGYGVDVVFSPVGTGDRVPPSLVSTSPVAGATSVPLGASAVAAFDEALLPSSVVATLTGPAGTVPVTVTVGADRTVTLTPVAPLAFATTYSADVSGSDLAGNLLQVPARWSFRTATAPSTACPCSLWPDDAVPATPSDSDTRPVDVGVKVFAASDGALLGLRFYKGPANTGVHVGTLWGPDGVALATATFTGESAAGWQQVAFASPVPVTAGTTYTASYRAPNGGFASTPGGLSTSGVTRGPLTAPQGTDAAPNGVFLYGSGGRPVNGSSTNYWVDVVFDTVTPTDTTPPTVTSVSPVDAAVAVAPTSGVGAVFSEAVAPASVSLSLRSPAGTAVAGSTAYDASTRTATFTPSLALSGGTTYTASAGASDVAGNAMATPRTWSFTTVDTTAPTLTSRTPATGSTGVPTRSPVTAGFSKPVTGATLTLSTGTPAVPVPGTSTYDAAARTLTLTPSAALQPATTYTVAVTATDLSGNALVAGPPWTFTTVGPAGAHRPDGGRLGDVGHRQMDHGPADDLRRRVRHLRHGADLDGDRRRPERRARRPADGAAAQHALLLPRHLRGRRGPVGDLAGRGGRARVVRPGAGPAGPEHGRRLLHRHAGRRLRQPAHGRGRDAAPRPDPGVHRLRAAHDLDVVVARDRQLGHGGRRRRDGQRAAAPLREHLRLRPGHRRRGDAATGRGPVARGDRRRLHRRVLALGGVPHHRRRWAGRGDRRRLPGHHHHDAAGRAGRHAAPLRDRRGRGPPRPTGSTGSSSPRTTGVSCRRCTWPRRTRPSTPTRWWSTRSG